MEDPAPPPTPSPTVFSLASSTKVPNVFPTESAPYRLAIIGEAPGEHEEAYKTPFIGASGDFLNTILSGVGINRKACFVGNVCKYRPPGNKIDIWGYDHEKVQEGLRELREELAQFRPYCCLLLGNTPLWALLGSPYGVPKLGFTITEEQGSIMQSDFLGLKCVPALHPAAVLREYKGWPLLRLFTKRAFEESHSPELVLPIRNFDLDLTCDEICHRLDSWPEGQLTSIDIEGGLKGWTCISVSDRPDHAFIIAFGSYSASEQGRIYRSLSRFLYRADIPKVLQNGLYDAFVLFYGYNMLIRNIREDTLLKAAEIYPELPKALDTQAAIWTRQPNWKHLIAYSKKEQQRRAKLGVDPGDEIRNRNKACCIDSSVTLEISLAQDQVLLTQPGNRKHYYENVALLRPFLYMEKRGIRYHSELAAQKRAEVQTALNETHTRLNVRAGFDLLGKGGSVSDDRVKTLLYEKKGYPVQYNGRGPNKKIASDIGALLRLTGKFPNDPLLSDLLLASKLDGIRKTLSLTTDPDGRMRASYSPVGTETMRVNCKTSPTGSGGNLQTITKKLRLLYLADEGKFMAQMDLSGADGWTVAAYCMRHGDSTMLDDYLFGLKPAKIIALMYVLGPEQVLRLSRPELKALCKQESKPGGICDPDGWLYFACKRVQHASNYGTKAKTGIQQILEDSYKISGTPVFVSESDFQALQNYYFLRYPGIARWHVWAKKQVYDGHNLTVASGHTRTFFGRRREYNQRLRSWDACPDTWREFLADEPQENTTYATNLAMLRLWTDPDNRSERPNGRGRMVSFLRIEPLHQVHDALIVQFDHSDLDFALHKIPHWFNNPLTIADQQIVIPFEGAYGPSWGELGEKYGGGEILAA